MSRTDLRRLLAAPAVAALAMTFTTIAAAAEEAREVIVAAPEVSRQKVGRASNGAPVELITVQNRVSYADLNLAKTADAAQLEARIKTAATHACAELQKLVPFETPDPKCAQKAAAKAMQQESAAIAAASR